LLGLGCPKQAFAKIATPRDFNSNQDNVTAGVVVEIDIFSGFRTSEKIKKAAHQLAAAEKTVTQTR